MLKQVTSQPDAFFPPRFGDKKYVAALLRLVQLLADQYAAEGFTGRYVEILREELASIYDEHQEYVLVEEHGFKPTVVFPSKVTLPRTTGQNGLETVRLDSLSDRTQFLAFLFGRYVAWATANSSVSYALTLSGISVALSRLYLDYESRARAT